MALDDLPGEIVVFTRDEIYRRYLRSYRIRQPDADTGPKTQPAIDAATFADQQVVVYNDAQVIGERGTLKGTRGAALDEAGKAEGVPRLPASGGTGFVTITASTGGGTILVGAELLHAATGLIYKCLETDTYLNDEEVPIGGVDSGPTTNLPAGTILEWRNPPPGIGQIAVVAEQSDGSGLTGGRDVESDPDYQARIAEKRADPPASGNDAEYQKAIEKTPGIAIQKAFSWPALKGSGTTAVAFTLRPATASSSRRPNAAQRAQVRADLEAAFPGDDGIFDPEMLAQSTAIVLEVTWAKRAAGWVDAAPWPPYVATSTVKVNNGAAITATGFRAVTGISTLAPQVGQTIAVFDTTSGKFKRKRILTVSVVSAGLSWDLTFDTSNAASDVSFAPVHGALISPWSTSLDALVPLVTTYMHQLGPGEMVPSFSDPGIRQRRQPESPTAWPSVITNRILDPIFGLAAIGDAALLEPTVPHATTVGTPGATVYLQELGDLAVFQQ